MSPVRAVEMLLIFSVSLFICWVMWCWISAYFRTRTESSEALVEDDANMEKYNKMIERQVDKWGQVDKVTELASLYLDIVLKHGPDSEEAKAFRFGVDNENIVDNEALQSFYKIVVIIDNGLRKNKFVPLVKSFK